jgi:DNA-binding GntR family transcriptional regulator
MLETNTDANEGAGSEGSGSLATSAYDLLREDLLSGRFRPGEKLRIETLRAHYGIGSSPLREALSRLSVNGLVTHEDQRGFRAATVSREDMQELLRTRCWAEEIALSDSILHGRDDWEEAVLLAFHRLSRVPRSTRNDTYSPNDEWEHRHRNFHKSLLSSCRSRWMLQFCDQLFEQTDRYRHIAIVASFPQRDELAEHLAIEEAAINRDAAEAVRLLHAHYKRTGEIIADSISDTV